MASVNELIKVDCYRGENGRRSGRFVGEAKTSGIERRLLACVSLFKNFALRMQKISTSSASGGCNYMRAFLKGSFRPSMGIS